MSTPFHKYIYIMSTVCSCFQPWFDQSFNMLRFLLFLSLFLNCSFFIPQEQGAYCWSRNPIQTANEHWYCRWINETRICRTALVIIFSCQYPFPSFLDRNPPIYLEHSPVGFEFWNQRVMFGYFIQPLHRLGPCRTSGLVWILTQSVDALHNKRTFRESPCNTRALGGDFNGKEGNGK